MTMYEIIMKKRNGGALNEEEIRYFIRGVAEGSIPDYQTAALMMAVYFRGMDARETAILTDAMVHSGEVVDLSGISGIKVDKHSTGGVGDKTTLVLAPMVAACGLKMAKMSGRGLGHTGGTLDKLEAIPGCSVQISPERFTQIVNEIGLCVTSPSGTLAPADQKLYALRDVTATVDNISLIASSIMSKKLAAGADLILLDVKYGSGAFMKTPEDACALAREMVQIGRSAGKKTDALVTGMEVPLGYAVGNQLEVIEAVETLRGNGPEDLTELCVALAARMMYLAQMGSEADCREKALGVIRDGSAFEKLKAMVRAQGGDDGYLADTAKFSPARYLREIPAEEDGYISSMDAECVGRVSVLLGAGREKKEDAVDAAAGILLRKKTGDFVRKGEPIAQLHTNRPEVLPEAERRFSAGVRYAKTPPQLPPLIRFSDVFA